MAHIAGYMAIGLFTLAGFVAVFGMIDAFIQLHNQDKNK
jgi:Mn2+/Fe2+ NRAMP family transporter